MRASRHGSQSGQILVVLAFVTVALIGLAAVSIDTGLAAADRRDLQSYADSAAMAGAQEYSTTTSSSAAHYVALLYVQKSLGESSMASGCTMASCPAGSYTFSGGYTVTVKDPATEKLDVAIEHTRPTTLAGVLGITTTVDASSGRAEPPAQNNIPAGYAVAAVGAGSCNSGGIGDGCVHIDGGGAGTQNVTGPIYATYGYGANNGPHATGTSSDVAGYGGTGAPGSITNCASPPVANTISVNGSGDQQGTYSPSTIAVNSNVSSPAQIAEFTAEEPTSAGSTFASAAQAMGADGKWQPGTYTFAPNFTTAALDPGVYRFSGVTSGTITLGSNAVNTGTGQLDAAGAVSIVLDSTDNGVALNIDAANINGIDDLGTTGTVTDPLGTHNFAIWGGTWTGDVTIGANATPVITGIVFLPNSKFVTEGTASPTFAGSTYVDNFTVHGNGNGFVAFDWVCGLGAVNASPAGGGLVR